MVASRSRAPSIPAGSNLNDFLMGMLCKQIKSEVVAVPFSQYADDPIGFITKELGVGITTAEQEAIMLSVRDKPATNVRAGNSVGKTFIASCIVLYWVFCVGGLVVTTAPTEGQVKELLWSEIRKLYARNRHKLGGQCGIMTLRLNEDARAYGFVARDYDSNAFQGKHGQRLLLILDEACGISREIDDAAESCVTGSSNRILRIGNPISSGNPFSEACAKSSIAIPSWGHPNVVWAYEMCEDGIHRLKPEVAAKIVDPNNPDEPILPQHLWDETLPKDPIPGAVSISWIERVRRKGENSAFWRSRVEAKFPTGVRNCLIQAEWWHSARKRYDDNPEYWKAHALKHRARHGLDVGDGGDDHCYARWRGYLLEQVTILHTVGDREDVDRAADLGWKYLNANKGVIAVDRVGVGAGALSNLIRKIREKEFEDTMEAIGYVSNQRKTGVDTDKYYDRITQDAWRCREAFRDGLIAVAPIDKETEDRIISEFESTAYEEVAGGVIRLEPKDKTKKRLENSSPDARDGILIAFGVPVLNLDETNMAVGEERSIHAETDSYLEDDYFR